MKNKLVFNIALLTLALYLILERFTGTHDMILGILMGISIAFFLINLLPQKLLESLRNLKKELILKK